MTNVPFFPNKSEGGYCAQAAVGMVLAYFEGDFVFDYEAMAEFTGKLPGMATWPTYWIIALRERGYQVIVKDDEDIEAFIANPELYMREKYGDEYTDWQLANCDIERERQLMIRYKELEIQTYGTPTLSELKRFIRNGWLVKVTINPFPLRGEDKSYGGHAVIVIDCDEDSVTLHDPGMPPHPSWTVSNDLFNKGWANPNESAKNYVAIKK